MGVGDHLFDCSVLAVDRAVGCATVTWRPTEHCCEIGKIPIALHQERPTAVGDEKKGVDVAFVKGYLHRTSPKVKGTWTQAVGEDATDSARKPVDVRCPVPDENSDVFFTGWSMNRGALSEHGFYVDLLKAEGGDLEIVLNENGQRHFEEVQEVRDRFGIEAALHAILEDHLGNGWEMVPPEDIGALTAAPILSEEVLRDDEGTIVEIGRVYWFPDYAVRDEIEEVHTKLVLVFQGVE